ncbi:DNA mismatch endonuclease Vsr [Parvularcula flava]|uniref:Very short patch repair endonuclease n=2 Tax=Aquisalinus luteolus TaxID=1566827 RepID=A0ABX0HLH5_9PROT|nr:DNA mismatch endonuclease Vsr [Aquisalinus luteolus]
MDNLSTADRRKTMRSVRSKDTGPEMRIRRILHKAGYRYRLHRSDLPGKPDLVFSTRRKVIFVHGCFWHGHHCKKGTPPSSNKEFWEPKLARNRERDIENLQKLTKMRWNTLTLWECEIKSMQDTEILELAVEFLRQ